MGILPMVHGQDARATCGRRLMGNPVRAGIAKHAADWRWSSFSVRQGRDSKVGPAEGPLALPGDWESLVHCEIDPQSAEEIGKSVKRGRPLGDADWRTGTAKELNLEATLREKGDQKKYRTPSLNPGGGGLDRAGGDVTLWPVDVGRRGHAWTTWTGWTAGE